jgi:hypothetical protein
MTGRNFAKTRFGLRLLVCVAPVCLVAGAVTPTVTTFAGGYVGDGKPAISAGFTLPASVARDAKGNVYVSDSYGCRIRKIDTAGIISTIVGTGICGFSGDGGQASAARISAPNGIAFDRLGDLLIADTDNNRIRKVTPAGIIRTVAGNGQDGYSGDGGPATAASISFILGVSSDPSGNIYIADTNNNVVRKVDASGIIHTVAGNGTAGFSGDGGPATLASLNYVSSIAADANGNFYIADSGN